MKQTGGEMKRTGVVLIALIALLGLFAAMAQGSSAGPAAGAAKAKKCKKAKHKQAAATAKKAKCKKPKKVTPPAPAPVVPVSPIRATLTYAPANANFGLSVFDGSANYACNGCTDPGFAPADHGLVITPGYPASSPMTVSDPSFVSGTKRELSYAICPFSALTSLTFTYVTKDGASHTLTQGPTDSGFAVQPPGGPTVSLIGATTEPQACT
jgi:hypothetical protein